jgi:hypothetical protein
MFDAIESLMLDLLEWLASGERTYDEVMMPGARPVLDFQSGRTRTNASSSPKSTRKDLEAIRTNNCLDT